MKVRVNGDERWLKPGASLADLVEGDGKGVAIARNGEVVPRSLWADTPLREHDDIELVNAVQGG